MFSPIFFNVPDAYSVSPTAMRRSEVSPDSIVTSVGAIANPVPDNVNSPSFSEESNFNSSTFHNLAPSDCGVN